MPPYRFRLTTLLRIREAERDEKRASLADAQRAQDIVGAQIEQLQNDLGHLQRENALLARPGRVDVDALVDRQRFELLLKARRQQAEEQHRLVTAEVQRRREVLIVADQEVRVLERLRETQRDRHRSEEERRQHKHLDEIAAQQFVRKET
jgi:flagellar FliJ protein